MKCKQCGKEFKPFNSVQPVCSYICALKYNDKKQVDKRVKEMKKNLTTRSDYMNVLQNVFNKYIRLRDKGKKCISCDCFVNNGHASHFFSVGAYPNLRFNEDNCHLSCVECNLHKHGNSVEYALRLPNRISKEKFDKLVSLKNEPLMLSIPEIIEKIAEYKLKIKQL